MEGPCLLVDLVIGLVLAPTRNGATRSSWPGPLNGSALTFASDSSTWIGSELIPFPLVRTCEVFSATSKENPTPLFGVSLNFLLGDFPNLCRLGRVFGLARAGSRICTPSTSG